MGTPRESPYTLRDYWNITAALHSLASRYPHLLQLTSAQALYKSLENEGVRLTSRRFHCGRPQSPESCRTWIVRLASTRDATHLTPEVFLSGALHGDERLGPTILVEYLEWMCSHYGKHPIVTYLINTRSVWLLPMTNAWGFAHNHREELGTDPNRDFPYDGNDVNGCMNSITARVINELFREHLFQASITFHGGTRILGYEWGSPDHIRADAQPKHSRRLPWDAMPSTESPDWVSQKNIADALQAAAGVLVPGHAFPKRSDYGYRRLEISGGETNGQKVEFSERKNASPGLSSVGDDLEAFYPVGPMSDLVYPVSGGFEDWSYAGSWHGSPPIMPCRATMKNDFYPVLRTRYDDIAGLRCSTFLVETDYFKTPPRSSLGHPSEIFNPGGLDGHIPRNIRLILKLTELVKPGIVISKRPVWTPLSQDSSAASSLSLEFEFFPMGCHTIDAAVVNLYSNTTCAATSFEAITRPSLAVARIVVLNKSQRCRGIGVWEDWDISTPSMAYVMYENGTNGPWPGSTRLLKGAEIGVRIPAEVLGSAPGPWCAVLETTFDGKWGAQVKPDPPVPPQTHLVLGRTKAKYTADASKSAIRETRVKRFVINVPAIPWNNTRTLPPTSWNSVIHWTSDIDVDQHEKSVSSLKVCFFPVSPSIEPAARVAVLSTKDTLGATLSWNATWRGREAHAGTQYRLELWDKQDLDRISLGLAGKELQSAHALLRPKGVWRLTKMSANVANAPPTLTELVGDRSYNMEEPVSLESFGPRTLRFSSIFEGDILVLRTDKNSTTDLNVVGYGVLHAATKGGGFGVSPLHHILEASISGLQPKTPSDSEPNPVQDDANFSGSLPPFKPLDLQPGPSCTLLTTRVAQNVASPISLRRSQMQLFRVATAKPLQGRHLELFFVTGVLETDVLDPVTTLKFGTSFLYESNQTMPVITIASQGVPITSIIFQTNQESQEPISQENVLIANCCVQENTAFFKKTEPLSWAVWDFCRPNTNPGVSRGLGVSEHWKRISQHAMTPPFLLLACTFLLLIPRIRSVYYRRTGYAAMETLECAT